LRFFSAETFPMNIANLLTVSRFFLSLLFVFALSIPVIPFQFTIALVLFLIAGITDYADGEIARRFNMETDFGRLMDPLVDKIMMAAAFICLVPLGAMPAWAATVIVSREFLITGLRLLAASKGRVLAAEKLGKHKTAWQIITAIFFLLMLSLGEFTRLKATPGAALLYGRVWSWGGGVLIAVTVALTIISGAGYLWKNRAVIETQ
jgi:CDP-diacylglycerol--glycerol-3-phosphate 3-phosphatidyltransferase